MEEVLTSFPSHPKMVGLAWAFFSIGLVGNGGNCPAPIKREGDYDNDY